ncbi:tRNA glutamyl-Q(34) synthetase GluQRS [Desulfovibrio sp. OttesenSCG-928-F07]|nr:tRNA glutamyl-Q(34) synthetase GluQRS [Desulfovibrio sp. OttesenSCG-928-F07]
MLKPANTIVRGRFAPSPTGFLHLGNAWAFLCAWLGARSVGGEIVMRFEDIDPQRAKLEFEHAIIEDLTWLGLNWDYGPGAPNIKAANTTGNVTDDSALLFAPYRQSENIADYASALAELEKRLLVYPCFCTRKELRSMAGAPQAGDGADLEGAYPGICRTLSHKDIAQKTQSGLRYAMRLRFEEFRSAYLHIDDLCLGPVNLQEHEAGGDFALRRSDGVFAYQLAVVLDDIRMGVTQVVRGMDILLSTPRQLFLYELFGATPPKYVHVPLMLDYEGERLAKRHAALSLRSLRAAGVTPELVIGYLAWWGGLTTKFEPVAAHELLNNFSFKQIKTTVPQLPADIEKVFISM